MPAPRIQAQFDDLKKIAETFNQGADEIQTMTKNLMSCKDTLKNGDWKGKGADQFYNEMDGEVLPTLKRLNEALAQASQITNQVVQTMQQAQDESQAVLRA